MAWPAGDPWQEPYRVTKELRTISYEIQCHASRRRKKQLHINDLRLWVSRENDPVMGLKEEPGELCEGKLLWSEEEALLTMLPLDGKLSPLQKEELLQAVNMTPEVFSARLR